MALPLPSVIPNQGPGGGVVNAMQGMQNLQNMMNENQIKAVQAQYAPMTTQADALSKIAYANLMGPQFLAKLMGNSDVVANSPQLQNPATIAKLYQAGMGAGTGNALMQLLGGQKPSLPPQQQPPPPQQQAPQQQVSQPNTAMPQPQSLTPGARAELGISDELWKAQNAWMKSPEGYAQAQRDGYYKPPQGQQLLDWYHGQQGTAQPVQGSASVAADNARQPTFAEKAGAYAGVKEEGKKLGQLRAEAIDDMGKQYQDAIQARVPIHHMMDLMQQPVFKNMRSQIPFFQDKQLSVLSKIGTPEQQKAIGDFMTTSQNLAAQTVNSFQGRALAKEFDIANKMKISPNDTWNTAIGKLSSIDTFNEMTIKRANIATKLMEDRHLNRTDAMEQADKQVDGEAIRKQVDAKLNPKPTDDDINYMASKYGISRDEVKNRLKQKGLL